MVCTAHLPSRRMRPLMIRTGQAQIIEQAAGPQEGMLVPIASRRRSLTTTPEGEAANDVSVPLLQPRELRLRGYREEVRCRQSGV